MSTLATLVVKLVGDTGEFSSAMDKSARQTEGFVGKMRSSLGTIGKVAMGIAGAGIVALGGAIATIGPQAIRAASDFEESFSKVNVVFGESADAVIQFSQTTATAMGISQNDALAAAGTFGNLFRTMGLGQPVSAQMSTDLVQLAADLASFNNLDPTEVLDKLRSGLVGETEPLRGLGINLTDVAVRARAVEMGLAKTTAEVDQAAMTQARFALIMEQSALAQGDFARTSDGLANGQRTLGAIWQDVLQKVGGVALPLVTGALQGFLGFLTGTALPGLERVITAFQDFQWMLGVGVEPLNALSIILQRFIPPETATAIVGAIQSIIGGIQTLITAAAPYVAQVMAWIGEHVKLQDVLLVLGAAIAYVVAGPLAAIVAAIAGPIALFAVLVAAVAAVRAAWESDFLGIRTAVESAWAGIQPALQTLVAWFQTNIPVAVQAVSDVWNNTLLPAFREFWAFLQNDLWPLLQAVGNFLSAVFTVATEAAAGIWQNVLYPALQKVAAVIGEKVQPALEKLQPFLDKVKDGVGGISEAVQKLIDWFGRMTEKIRDIKLPDWMTPGSPTPLEIGLLGIARALAVVDRQMSNYAAALPAPSPMGAMQAAVPAAAGVGGGGLANVTFHIDGARDPRDTANEILRRLQEIGVVPGNLLR